MKIDNVLIVKVGTGVLTRRNHRGYVELDVESFQRIGDQITRLQRIGFKVILVSSAAISAGMAITGMKARLGTREGAMPTLQSLASIGWRHVLNTWSETIDSTIGELLITRNELENKAEQSELLRVLFELLSHNYVPIINENDAVSHEEITFGDNDILAAHLALKIKQSDLFGGEVSVVLLSNVDGVYSDVNDSTTLIAQMYDTDGYLSSLGTQVSDGGTGGMASKFKAADLVMSAGVDLYIANGRSKNAIFDVMLNATGTHFVPHSHS